MSIASHELPARCATGQRDSFALTMALVMLAVNLVGFAPTLYLRPLFDPPPIPLYLYVHGILGTAWFVLVSAQALLVANGRIAVHRRLGWGGACVAAAVLISGVVTSTNMVPRNVALGLTSAADIELYSAVTTADYSAFIIFPALVLFGVIFRRRADVHKRLMLLASLSILGPALARIASWLAPIPSPIVPLLLLGFLAAFLVHDLWSRRRPHAATVLGILLLMGTFIGMRLAGVGEAIVEARLEQALAP
jgi:hypothetical protein